MKKLILVALLGAFTVACSDDGGGSNNEERVCGEYNGKTLYTGPKGGCYYKQADGDKTYVDRKYCDCLKN